MPELLTYEVTTHTSEVLRVRCWEMTVTKGGDLLFFGEDDVFMNGMARGIWRAFSLTERKSISDGTV
jgi:hypothetical protein